MSRIDGFASRSGCAIIGGDGCEELRLSLFRAAADDYARVHCLHAVIVYVCICICMYACIVCFWSGAVCSAESVSAAITLSSRTAVWC